MATDMIARALAKNASKNYNSFSSKKIFPTIGESGQLYFDTSTKILYYWDEENLSYKMLVTIEGNEDIVTKELVSESVEDYMNDVILDGGGSAL